MGRRAVRGIASALAIIVGMLGWIETAHSQALKPKPSRLTDRSQKEAELLRQRIAGSTKFDSAFWQLVKRLERLGPADTKVAVVKHPGAVVVYYYRNINGIAVADEDIELGPYAQVQFEQARLRGEGPEVSTFAVVTSETSQWWPNHVIPFEVDSGLENRAVNAIRDAIREFESKTPLKFIERTEDHDAYIKYVKQLECCGVAGHLASMSDIGMHNGENTIKIQTIRSDGSAQDETVLRRAVLHETGHVLGFYHEHVRPDRDDFVRVDFDCIDFWYQLGNFSIPSESQKIGPYDFESIMHYGSTRGEKGPFWDRKSCFSMVKRRAFRSPGDSTGEIFPAFTLSTHDVNAIHHMYGRDGELGQAGDSFGFRLLAHDFDRDGFPDLAVGVPRRNGGRGAVYMYKGTATGYVLWKFLRPSGNTLNSSFGWSLAAGDFDGDGIQDLAVGAPRARVSGKAQAGRVFLFRIRGDRDAEEFDVLSKNEIGADIEIMDRFGWSLASGFFFDQILSSGEMPRVQLAIGAPGARDGDRGRTGRVWILNSSRDERFQEVVVPGAGSPKFGQFGFSMVSVPRGAEASFSSEARLIVSAPGVTFGGCGEPRVYTTRVSLVSLETVQSIPDPDARRPSPSCPQDPNLSDAIDAYPSPVWDAGFGAVMAAGDFDGDGTMDLATSGSSNVHIYRGGNSQYDYLGVLRASDFSGHVDHFSFGSALAAGDLSGNGRSELLVGAPLKSIGNRTNVGKVYVYGGCVPQAPSTFAPNGLCRRSLSPWFVSHQSHSQVISVPNGLGGIREMLVEISPNRSDDRFGMSLAVAEMPKRDGTDFTYLVGSPDNAFDGEPRAGAVFHFKASVSGGNPPFRNTQGLNQSFATKLERR